jgi:hypothetical protein
MYCKSSVPHPEQLAQPPMTVRSFKLQGQALNVRIEVVVPQEGRITDRARNNVRREAALLPESRANR